MARILASLSILVASLSLTATPALALPTINEDVEASSNSLLRRQDINPAAIRFEGWQGCSEAQQSDIRAAWKELLMLGKAVNMDVDWKAPRIQATRDFFGSEMNNQKYQFEIQAILKNIETWKDDGTILAWQLNMRCDDHLRRAELNCPGRTKPEWEYRCNSRCWAARTERNPDDGQYDVVEWSYRAAAYTTSSDGPHVGSINFCPKFFDTPTCNDAMNKAVNDYPAGSYNRLRLKNYECRGYIALHELFHIDQMPSAVTKYKVTHIWDRMIKIRSRDGDIMNLMAYGPQFTKAMAKYTLGGGLYVATNADNLALYALAVWATSRAGDYPRHPEVPDIDRPIQAPSRGSFAVFNDNGIISLVNDTESIMNSLGVTQTDAFQLQAYRAQPQSCSDVGKDATVDRCVDDPDNKPLDLKPGGGDQPVPPAPPMPARPADFNCSCGESGCSPGSMACCANGSCQCHCVNGACLAEDP
ncbi:uncharacterized protein BDR25DRAFT_380739 [Lindgomyces ingoldianus]|uniref:Uncharacterized protein n=1 Tax=Lindgomyces ingoldianus TaxID=673940 RepID=A0ACB6QC93_9PLEO|nr:uncharacterized protein BDR25DRAFT_380739 [Lindgomyces ingoldianus]KAF2464544.1 hypothetical protein BDR25DRAFT_380739 [Lindgomyces ingoldianus]